jgi:hypothetical protein
MADLCSNSIIGIAGESRMSSVSALNVSRNCDPVVLTFHQNVPHFGLRGACGRCLQARLLDDAQADAISWRSAPGPASGRSHHSLGRAQEMGPCGLSRSMPARCLRRRHRRPHRSATPRYDLRRSVTHLISSALRRRWPVSDDHERRRAQKVLATAQVIVIARSPPGRLREVADGGFARTD